MEADEELRQQATMRPAFAMWQPLPPSRQESRPELDLVSFASLFDGAQLILESTNKSKIDAADTLQFFHDNHIQHWLSCDVGNVRKEKLEKRSFLGEEPIYRYSADMTLNLELFPDFLLPTSVLPWMISQVHKQNGYVVSRLQDPRSRFLGICVFDDAISVSIAIPKLRGEVFLLMD